MLLEKRKKNSQLKTALFSCMLLEKRSKITAKYSLLSSALCCWGNVKHSQLQTPLTPVLFRKRLTTLKESGVAVGGRIVRVPVQTQWRADTTHRYWGQI